MAKVTWGSYGKDAPIFKEGSQVFVPASRPPTSSSPSGTDGASPPPISSQSPDPMQPGIDALEAWLTEHAKAQPSDPSEPAATPTQGNTTPKA